jgi:uncharacterized membrane protein YoaK (UPF0700 family)
MDAKHYGNAQGMALGFLAGYVDTLGFVALFGLFTAHVTGNFILIGAALANASQTSILLKILTFPCFILGVAAARVLVVAVEQRGGAALRPALLLELILLLGCMASGTAAEPIGGQAGPLAMLAGLLGAAGMGAHSATSRLLLGHLAPTSMMTGNVTQIVIDAVDVLRGVRDPGMAGRFAKFALPLLAFAAGCIAAAFGYRWFGFAALAVPVLILVGLLAWDTLAVPAGGTGNVTR